jgi:uncharacterized heparinase superfamily protein
VTGLGTYWRTLRHLRPQQVVGRIRFRLTRPRPDMRPAPPRRTLRGPWAVPARREASLAGDATFDFLGERHALNAIGWDDPAVAKLWRYNLHYFDDLNAIDAEQRASAHADLIRRWIAENPPAAGTGWEPYTVSLRIVNWIKWAMGGGALCPAATHSLAVQARWLCRRLERHLLGNHLFANAKALVYAGLFFKGQESDGWLRLGCSILEREVHEQLLPDGGQFERSPMYHALAVEDLLDLVNLIDAAGETLRPLRSELVQRLPAMLRWLNALSHPDGTLALFNDTAQGIAPANCELLRYAAALGVTPAPGADAPLMHLRDSGYLRFSLPPMVALLDLAPIGPDYLPGHGHADTLSFELSLGSKRVIVNGGTSCYGVGPQRRHERSTAAHSTVTVGGQDSSEVWSGFRVGRRARPGVPQVTQDGARCEVECMHDGYQHLPGRPLHRRRWSFGPGALIVTDMVGNPRLAALARFHLAPGLVPSPTGPGAWVISDRSGELCNVSVLRGEARLEPSTHAQRFGVVESAHCIAITLQDGSAITRWTWRA